MGFSHTALPDSADVPHSMDKSLNSDLSSFTFQGKKVSRCMTHILDQKIFFCFQYSSDMLIFPPKKLEPSFVSQADVLSEFRKV